MTKIYQSITSFENLSQAYYKARRGKQEKPKICHFEFFLEEEIGKLKHELETEQYQPSTYTNFMVFEPKTRQVAAPAFRDRVVQHSLVSVIEPWFEKRFIYDSYACRKNKGTHFCAKRIKKFLMAARTKYGANQQIYFLQTDIRKFFESISWDILLDFIRQTITCPKTNRLIEKIITANHNNGPAEKQKNLNQLKLFTSEKRVGVSPAKRRGLPLGNLTSQLFANVYLDRLDHFVKDRCRERWYGRYMDDFLVIHPNKDHLLALRDKIKDFLKQKLKLKLHPRKQVMKNVKDGIPFVGYRIFYDHVLVRGDTLLRLQRNLKKKRQAYREGKITKQKLKQTEASIKGHLKHADSYHLRQYLFKEEKAQDE